MDRQIRILHLEDNPQDAELIRSSLLEAGYDCLVTRVQTAEDFSRNLKGFPYDLILSDHTLPGYDGLSALETARKQAPDVPFVFVSGTIGEETAVDSLLKGASEYVLKNNMKRLVPAVRRTLEEAERSKTRRRAEKVSAENEDLLQREKNREVLEKLAGRVAHDINGLLTVISGYAELARSDLGSAAPAVRDMDSIINASEKASLLIQHLLAFSQKQVSNPRVIDINDVILAMDERLRRLLGERASMATALAPVLGKVLADPVQVEQIIMNLAANALDAMPAGGRLRIETADVELTAEEAKRFRGLTPGPHVLMAVSDTGGGINEENQERIFEPFFSEKNEGKGTGMGLAAVYGIVRQNNGFIHAMNLPEEGTVFRIHFPTVREVVKAPPVQAPGAGTTLCGTETILLVDDEEPLRKLLHRVLTAQGYTVLTAAGPAEAVSICEKHPKPIHLLLTDICMPVMKGNELAGRLLPRFPRMRVLFMTGHVDPEVMREEIVGKGRPYLKKPFQITDFLRKVREVLVDEEAVKA